MADIVTVVFDPPLLSDSPGVFDVKAQAAVESFPTFVGQLNTLRTAVNADKTDAASSASAAAGSASAAASSAAAALAAALSTAATWQASTSYALNDVVWGTAAGGTLYRCILAYAGGATPPASDPTHWVQVTVDPADVAALQVTADTLLDVPVVAKTAAYTLALGDRGKCISTTAGITIPANASVAFPPGTTIKLRNTSASAVTVSITSDTLRQAGTTKTGARSLAAYGECVLHKDSATVWYASGNLT